MSANKNIQMTSRSITKQSSDNRLIEEEDKQQPKDIDEVDTARKSAKQGPETDRRDTYMERIDTRVET